MSILQTRQSINLQLVDLKKNKKEVKKSAIIEVDTEKKAFVKNIRNSESQTISKETTHRRFNSDSISTSGTSTNLSNKIFDNLDQIILFGDEIALENLINSIGNPLSIINYRDNSGATIIHILCRSTKSNLLKSILKFMYSTVGENMTKIVLNTPTTKQCYTPLHYACMQENVESIKLLLDHGAYPNCVSNLGTSPLIIAVSANSFANCEILLKYGASPNTINMLGNVPLITAIKNNNENIVEILLKKKANPRLVKNGKPSARTVALEINNDTILKLLEDYAENSERVEN